MENDFLNIMKKLFLAFVAMFCFALTSCTKGATYTVNYNDTLLESANSTFFEYDFDLIVKSPMDSFAKIDEE